MPEELQRNYSSLSDVESAEESFSSHDKELQDAGGVVEETQSLQEAKENAREKFDWLTSHSLIERSCHDGYVPEWSPVRKVDFCLEPGASSHAAGSAPAGSPGPGRRGIEATPAIAAPGSYRSASRYLSACAHYSLKPNGGALLGLSLGLQMLEVDCSITNLELVPLCAALLDANFVEHLKLSTHPLQDTGAAVLALALPGCPWIKELELVGCKITGEGAKLICNALPKSGVQRLVLRNNLLRQNSETGNSALAKLVEHAPLLKSLDLQSSGLSSEGMRRIKQALGLRARNGHADCTVDFEGNFVLVEVLNSLTHGACALIALEGWRRLNTISGRLCHIESRLAVVLYPLCMELMFIGSTLYHSMFAVTDLTWFFRMIDHCAIYFLIAGTYTPVLMLGCRHLDTLRIMDGAPALVFVYWAVVTLGIIMEHFFAARKTAWYSKFILSMYVLLGFGGVPYIATCPLVQTGDVMGWIELGGLTYVVGIVFFLLDKRYPAMHVIWHLLVGLAAFFHFVAVWNLTQEVLSDPDRSCKDEGVFNFHGVASLLFNAHEDDVSLNGTTSAIVEARQL